MKRSPTFDLAPTQNQGSDFARLAIALLFLGLILAFSFFFTGSSSNHLFLAIAAVFGGYMAMNIGGNDDASHKNSSGLGQCTVFSCCLPVSRTLN